MLINFHVLSQNLSTLAMLILGPRLSFVGGHPGHYRMLSSILSLCPLVVHMLLSSVVPAKNACRHCHVPWGQRCQCRNPGVTHLTSHTPLEVPLDRVALPACWLACGRAGACAPALPCHHLAQRRSPGTTRGCRIPYPCVWHGMGPRDSRAPGRKYRWPGH